MSTYRFIAAERANHHVVTLCRMLGVSRSGFYDWQRRPPSRRTIADAEAARAIRRIHEGSRRSYGAPRVWMELRYEGRAISRKRVARLMRSAGLQGAHHRRRRSKGGPRPLHALPDLVGRDFGRSGPDRLWVADITYWPTGEGWLHLAVVIDAYSRRCVGWAMAPHLRTELVADALEMARTRRSPAPGLVHHSDQGTQYTSYAFGSRLREAGILGSVGRVGDAYDNAVAEAFFATIKRELLRGRRFETRAEAASAIFEWIEVFYNRQRRHTTIGGVSPAEFERSNAIAVLT